MSGWLNRDTNVVHAHAVLTGGYYRRGTWSACGRLKVAEPIGQLRSNVEFVAGLPEGTRQCERCIHQLREHRDRLDQWLRGDG